MMKKFLKFVVVLLLSVVITNLLIATPHVFAATNTKKVYFYTKILSSSETNSVLNIVRANEGDTAYNKAYYLFYNSQYAAAYKKSFPYTNATYPHSAVVDNGVTYSVTKSGGCMTYSNYVCKYVFGTNATSATRKYADGTKGAYTEGNIQTLITNHAQFGEHIRISDTHSISFVAFDSNGFYYMSYSNDNNPYIYVAYTTWGNFATKCNTENQSVWIYNTITTTNPGGVTVDSPSPTVSNGYSGYTNEITDSNALLYGTVTKPASYLVEKFGIRVRKTNDTYANGWSYFHNSSSNYSGTSQMRIWFDLNTELGLTLTHATSYAYQLYTKINGVEYWGPEATFTTTGAHSYGGWYTTQSPTCTVNGTQRRDCACGAYETSVIYATNHNYSLNFTVDIIATCTTNGSKSRHCTVCGSKTDVTNIAATGHNFGAYIPLNSPTCTLSGESVSKCVNCGTIDTIYPAALGHSYTNIVDNDCNTCGQTRAITFTGWVQASGSKWCYYKNGIIYKNRWAKDSNGWCWLGQDGYMVTSRWVKDTKGWCYLGADGHAYTNRWAKDSKGWCWLGADNYMVTSRWIKDTKGWCYLGADGYAYTNRWAKDSKGWCWLGADNYMVTSRWIKDTKGWCYLGADGYAYSNRWVKDSKGWCYVGSDNYMVTNTYVYDSIGKCWINSSGYWDGKYVK